MVHNTLELIVLGLWFAFMLAGGTGLLMWVTFRKIEPKKKY